MSKVLFYTCPYKIVLIIPILQTGKASLRQSKQGTQLHIPNKWQNQN